MIDFNPLIGRIYARILTQLNRDPHTAHYGSFDRNWWHYKIRDFSSIILQQGGFFLAMAAQLPAYREVSDQLKEYARASAGFWAARAGRRGAFEEYYPWEDGYPPLAFSTLAVSGIILSLKPDTAPFRNALKKAARKLQQRFEAKAANQQIAGLAALAALRKIDPDLVDKNTFERLTKQTLALQSDEGWFTEYDGPDLGYLSVSLDCLWDLYDYTGDRRFLDSATNAFRFLATLVIHNQGAIGMHNARNTDYIVPYGISRFLSAGNPEDALLASQVMEVLYADTENPGHFFQAVDDRYWSHYIGHSVVRAQRELDRAGLKDPVAPAKPSADALLPECGTALQTVDGHRIMVSCLKGGILSIRKGEKYLNDFGWIIFNGRKQFVTHWWSLSNRFSGIPGALEISGNPVLFKENTSTPLKHFVLRVVSFFSGHKIISILKDLLIFRKSDPSYSFIRKVQVMPGSVIITDTITGLKGGETVVKAPRFSKRHVASADSFHREDLEMIRGYEPRTEISRNQGVFTATTVVDLVT